MFCLVTCLDLSNEEFSFRVIFLDLTRLKNDFGTWLFFNYHYYLTEEMVHFRTYQDTQNLPREWPLSNIWELSASGPLLSTRM